MYKIIPLRDQQKSQEQIIKKINRAVHPWYITAELHDFSILLVFLQDAASTKLQGFQRSVL